MKKSSIGTHRFFIVLLSLLHVMVAPAQQPGKIFGVWQNSELGVQMTVILMENGTGEIDGDAIKFTTQGNKLSVTSDGQTMTYTFVVQGNSLKLSEGDFDHPMIFTRRGTNEKAPAKTTTAPSPRQTSTSATVDNNNIVGIWSGNNEAIEFKSNGQCSYGQQIFPYEISQSNVILTTAQGKVSMPYKINGDQLTLTINGQQAIYKKGAGNMSAQNNTSGSNHVAMELAGKWCYVDVTSSNSGGSSAEECITLNGNGTYQYYSERSMSTTTSGYSGGTSSQNGDQGTWSVNGDRIFYNSAKSGQGSYQLQKRNHPKNNDPMIVLDGKTFVTQYQKAPW